MARVEVRQLRYRGEPAKAARVEHAVADALRTEVVDDGRLILVRSFRLGRIGLGDHGASRAAASAWRTVRDGARHGGASGAESANCVWFADAAEARALLMRELARGQTPFAWFWVLAVPDWQRITLSQWLGRRLDEAMRDASGEALAALVAEAGVAGCIEVLAQAIIARIPAPRAGEPSAILGDGPARIAGAGIAQSADRAVQPVEDAGGQAVALAIVRSIPAPLRRALAAAAARAELATFVEALARGLVRHAHPALALLPARVAAIAAAVARIVRLGEPGVVPEPAPAAARSRTMPAREAPAARGDPPRTGGRELAPMAPAVTTTESAPSAVSPAGISSMPAEHFPAELRSVAAGVFLAIVPLLHLGWREWLVARPHLLTHQPGPRLLRRIAAHYRVPASDALWQQLPLIDLADDPPPELEQALPLWRKGLDGWLRRKARLRLAELVLRQGWLLPGIETTLVRFPLQAIEIRLRRLALDRDPGWVDWLGHSYRVVYRDRPLVGLGHA